MEKRVIDASVTVQYRDVNGKQEPVAFVGEAVVTGKRSLPLFAWGKRSITEVIDPAALDGADLSDVLGCFNHDFNMLLGRSTAGTMKLTRTGTGGLSYSIDYDATDPDHVRAMRKIEKKEVIGSSFMFDIPDDDEAAVLRTEVQEGDGVVVEYRVMKIKRVYELGPVTMPAYPDAKAGARSLYGRSIDSLREPEVIEPAPPDLDSIARRVRLAQLV